MAKVLTSQSDIERIFKRLERDYGALNKRQQAYAIREIGRIRGEIAEFLAEYADDEGVISRRRAGMVLRDLDEIERSLRKQSEEVYGHIIGETSEWTATRLNKAIGLTASTSAVNKHVFNYVTKRFGEDGLVLSERIWGLSGEIRDELSTVIRSGIIKGESVSTMIPKIRRAYDNETWKIRRLARTESSTAHRAAIGYNAQESEIVEWVRFIHGDKETEECVNLSREDRYGKGAGIFKPTDTDIWLPHINCTGYSEYVLDERWL